MNKRVRAKDFETEYGIRRFQVYALVRAKKIPHVRIGRMIIFDRDEIDAWFQRHKVRETNK